MVTLLELIPYFVAIGTPLLVIGGLIILKKTKLTRTISSSNETAILDHYNVLMNINEDQKATLNSQRMKITMLQKKIVELEGYEEEPAKEPEIDLKLIAPIATKLGIPESQLQLILQSDEAQKFLKKNGKMLQYVLPLLTQASKNKQDPSGLPPISESEA